MSFVTSISSVASAPNAATMLDVAMLGSTSPTSLVSADVPMPSPTPSTTSMHMLSRSASLTSNISMRSTACAIRSLDGNPPTSTSNCGFPAPIVAYILHQSLSEVVEENQQGYTSYPIVKAECTDFAPAALASGATVPTSNAVTLNTLQGSHSFSSFSGAILSPTQVDAEDKGSACLGTGSGSWGTSAAGAAAISRTPTPFPASHTPTPSVADSRSAVTSKAVSVTDAAESINRLTPDIGPVSPVTPEMDDELPIIQGLNKHELFEFVHSGTRHEWEATPGPKVVIFIAGDTIVTHDQLHSRVLAIRNVLKKIFPESDPIVGSAEPVPASHHHQPVLRPVFPYLISGISILQAQVLTTRLCWPMSDLTFFALDLSPPSTSFVMTLSGLHLPLMVESNEAVASLIRQKLFASSSVTSIIRRYNENLPPYLTRDEFIQFILSTVEVKGVRLGNHEECPVVFNVYIHPPTNNPHWHRAWLQEVRSVTFFAAYGTGKATPIFHCDTCKGRDHAIESCPFPMPGQQFLNSDDFGCNDSEMEDLYAVVFYFTHI
ncbi:hypothetical protein JOM56_014110 [Amanita muscaria]